MLTWVDVLKCVSAWGGTNSNCSNMHGATITTNISFVWRHLNPSSSPSQLTQRGDTHKINEDETRTMMNTTETTLYSDRSPVRHTLVESSWNVMVHGDAREGKWRENWRMEWISSTLYTTSERGVSSITTADAHTSAASSRLNWHPPSN